MFLGQEEQKDSQIRLINHKFQKVNKQMMIFEIEEVDFGKAAQAYKSSQIFDEMLQYYAYLNNWSIHPNEQIDQVEKFYYKHDLAVEQADNLYEATQQISVILKNLMTSLMNLINSP